MERLRAMRIANQPAWGDIPNAFTPSGSSGAQNAQSTPQDTPRESAAVQCDHPSDIPILFEPPVKMKLTPARAECAPAITSRGWTLEGLIATGQRFKGVRRVSALDSPERIGQAVRVYESGQPIVISDWHKRPDWPGEMFSAEWLLQHGEQVVDARNCLNWTDKQMTLPGFIQRSRQSTQFIEVGDTERYYGKDAKCPAEWEQWIDEGPLPTDIKPKGTNNIMQHLPASEQVETLMCYLGIGDTFTPAHKDLCASSGQNLMCYTENGGSSFWFMTESSSAASAAAYMQTMSYELDHEQKVVTPNEFARAPFKVFIAEQKLGDLVLVPKRSCHQVVNYGGLTIKASWSRMTVDGLVTAFYHELPIYRRLCRRETYRVKTVCYRAMLNFADEAQRLNNAIDARQPSARDEDPADNSLTLTSTWRNKSDSSKTKRDAIMADLNKCITLFDNILSEEHAGAWTSSLYTYPAKDTRPFIDASPSAHADGNHPDCDFCRSPDSKAATSARFEHAGSFCDFCGADVFQSFFACKRCSPPAGDSQDSSGPVDTEGLIICIGCYVEGRTCACTIMQPSQYRPIENLFAARNRAAHILSSLVPQGSRHKRKAVISDKVVRPASVQPSLFEAACVLWKRRKTIADAQKIGKAVRILRSCVKKKRHESNHTVPNLSALQCEGCHSSTCYIHLLQLGIHSSEALLLHSQGESHDKWHEFHVKQKDKLPEQKDQVENDEVTGSPPMLRGIAQASLAFVATKYAMCHPMSSNVACGWYDAPHYEKYLEATTPPSHTNTIFDDVEETEPSGTLTALAHPTRSVNSAFLSSPSHDSDVPESSPSPSLLSTNQGCHAQPTKSKKRTAVQAFLCVEVPTWESVLKREAEKMKRQKLARIDESQTKPRVILPTDVKSETPSVPPPAKYKPNPHPMSSKSAGPSNKSFNIISLQSGLSQRPRPLKHPQAPECGPESLNEEAPKSEAQHVQLATLSPSNAASKPVPSEKMPRSTTDLVGHLQQQMQNKHVSTSFAWPAERNGYKHESHAKPSEDARPNLVSQLSQSSLDESSQSSVSRVWSGLPNFKKHSSTGNASTASFPGQGRGGPPGLRKSFFAPGAVSQDPGQAGPSSSTHAPASSSSMGSSPAPYDNAQAQALPLPTSSEELMQLPRQVREEFESMRALINDLRGGQATQGLHESGQGGFGERSRVLALEAQVASLTDRCRFLEEEVRTLRYHNHESLRWREEAVLQATYRTAQNPTIIFQYPGGLPGHIGSRPLSNIYTNEPQNRYHYPNRGRRDNYYPNQGRSSRFPTDYQARTAQTTYCVNGWSPDNQKHKGKKSNRWDQILEERAQSQEGTSNSQTLFQPGPHWQKECSSSPTDRSPRARGLQTPRRDEIAAANDVTHAYRVDSRMTVEQRQSRSDPTSSEVQLVTVSSTDLEGCVPSNDRVQDYDETQDYLMHYDECTPERESAPATSARLGEAVDSEQSKEKEKLVQEVSPRWTDVKDVRLHDVVSATIAECIDTGNPWEVEGFRKL